MNKSPRALALEAQPFNPALLTIAGDATTPNGLRYVNTFLNDYRIAVGNPGLIASLGGLVMCSFARIAQAL